MNHNEEVLDFLGGLGDMLPADVLKKVNELLRAQSLMEPREKGLRITYQPMTINVFVRNDISGEIKDLDTRGTVLSVFLDICKGLRVFLKD